MFTAMMVVFGFLGFVLFCVLTAPTKKDLDNVSSGSQGKDNHSLESYFEAKKELDSHFDAVNEAAHMEATTGYHFDPYGRL